MTAIFMVVIVLVITVLDVILYFKKSPQATLSAAIMRYYNINRVAFLTTIGVGIVLGHLFWSMNTFDWMMPKDMKVKCEKFLLEYQEGDIK